MNVKVFFLGLFAFASLGLSANAAQTDDFQHRKDSLIKAVARAEGEAKLDAYFDLTALLFYYEQQTDTVLHYFDNYINEALKQGNLITAGKTKKNVISKLSNDSKYQQVIERADDALDFLAKNDLWDLHYDVYRRLIKAYFYTGEKETAIEKGKQMYGQAKRLNHSAGIQTALVAIGNIYSGMVRVKEAEDVFIQCLEEAEKSGEVSDIKISCYFNLVNLKNKQHQTEGTEELFNRWEKDIEKLEQQGRETSLPRHDLNREKLGFYRELKNWDKVEEYCKLLDNSNYTKDITQITVYDARAQMYIARKEWAKALTCVNAAYEIADRNGSLQNKVVFLRYKIDILYRLGRAEEGLSTLYNFEWTKDSITKLDYAAQIDELRTQYEVDRHIAEKQRSRNYAIFALCICLLLAVVLGIHIYYNRKLIWKNRELVRKAQQWANITPAPMIAEKDRDRDTDELPEEEPLPKTAEPDETDRLLFAEIELLIDRGLYKESNLSLDMLAEKTGQNLTYISKAVSRCTGKTFKIWLNEYRIKEAIRLLSDKKTPNISIDDLTFESGFNDRTTFYRVFKKMTGLSPTDFKKNGLNR